jgi:hypothetical protein
LDVLLAAEKITGAQEVWHKGMQRRLSSTLTEAGIIDTQHRTTGLTKEFDIIQMRGEVSRRPRTKQDNRGIILGHLRAPCLPYRLEPKAVQELALSVRESYLVGTQAEICWHLIAIPIRKQDEGIEEAMQHRRNNA